MSLRRYLSFLSATSLLAIMPLSQVAAVTSSTAGTTAAAATAAAQAVKLTNLKTKGAAEIDRRTAGLTSALTALQASTKLAATSKATLASQVQTELTSLAALKTKLTANTDLTIARADVQGIVTDYRVYVLMLPKVRLITAIDRITAADAQLTTEHDKLQAIVAQQKSAGHATTLQASLDDMTTKLTAAQTQLDGLTAKLLALQPTDYNTNHTILVGYRATLIVAVTSLKAARDDAKTVVTTLKAGQATPSPSPTTSSAVH